MRGDIYNRIVMTNNIDSESLRAIKTFKNIALSVAGQMLVFVR